MKARILSWSAFSIIGIGFTAFGQPQVMQLDDGTKLTLLGVTTGTRQMAPGYENLATANWLYTPDRPSMVWILAEHDQGKWPNYELLISDKEKTGCVQSGKKHRVSCPRRGGYSRFPDARLPALGQGNAGARQVVWGRPFQRRVCHHQSGPGCG